MRNNVRILLLATILCIGFVLFTACGEESKTSTTSKTPVVSEYERWKNSDEAVDLNDDGRITEEDHVLWKDYSVWRASEEAYDYDKDRRITFNDYSFFTSYEEWKVSSSAIDLNGDRKITMKDYELYRNPEKTNYITWMKSESAVDLNGDEIIDEQDWKIAEVYVEFIGSFRITDFTLGETYPGFVDSGFYLYDFAGYLPDIVFSVDKFGKTSWTFPEELKTRLGTDWNTVDNAVKNSIMERLSDKLSRLYVTIPSESVVLFAYLTEKEGVDYTTSFSYSFYDVNDGTNKVVEVSFDIVYD